MGSATALSPITQADPSPSSSTFTAGWRRSVFGTPSTQTSSPFFYRLPCEIREKIYRLHIEHSRQSPTEKDTDQFGAGYTKYPEIYYVRDRAMRRYCSSLPALEQTCRQAVLEVDPMIRGEVAMRYYCHFSLRASLQWFGRLMDPAEEVKRFVIFTTGYPAEDVWEWLSVVTLLIQSGTTPKLSELVIHSPCKEWCVYQHKYPPFSAGRSRATVQELEGYHSLPWPVHIDKTDEEQMEEWQNYESSFVKKLADTTECLRGNIKKVTLTGFYPVFWPEEIRKLGIRVDADPEPLQSHVEKWMTLVRMAEKEERDKLEEKGEEVEKEKAAESVNMEDVHQQEASIEGLNK